ncbi:TetR/AcrR family transcriptional regulator [Thermophilibacter immobilis]|jgi:AcrR family transcriptional regulator|uniref:TetR/AcrR family transcriptional regulator n=1 Tax=Thermophilibacter immobilis TaxID=2779519 RepID=A0A7S7MB62_9ACTN|nr:TetR/AcrR family transcriptional regulator [Thermophilibacter immobilis]QOY61193.1 TetR/AcrR family transcriptional regulator [Thermophilibacter immobilis]
MDRRQRKTRRAICDAFEDLLRQERYDAVTVSQIIERADIGRSTFYAHYETKDALLESMCDEMFAHIFKGVNKSCETHHDLRTATLEGKLAHLLYHLRDDHGGICGKLVVEREPHYTASFSEQLAELFESDLPVRPSSQPRDFVVDLLVSSFCEAVSWWLVKDPARSPEEVASWFLLPF